MTLRTSPGPARASTSTTGQRLRAADPNPGGRAIGLGILLILLGAALLVGLLQASRALSFDSLLVASKSLYNVITGLRSIGLGMVQTLLGIAQMLGFAALAAISIAAVLAILSGALRIGSHSLPRLSLVWNLLSQALHLGLRFLAGPRTGGRGREPARGEPARRDSNGPAGFRAHQLNPSAPGRLRSQQLAQPPRSLGDRDL